MHPLQAADQAVFRWVNTWPDALEILFIPLSEGNKWLPVRLGLLALLLYFLWNPRLRKPAIIAFIAWPIANELTDIFKNTFQMLRPSGELLDAVIRVNRLTSFGTASAHSANMMAVATAFLLYHRPLGYAWVVVAVLTGISRIYIGVHYPYQVLYGWATGAATAVAVAYLAELAIRHYQNRKTPPNPKDEPAPENPENSAQSS